MEWAGSRMSSARRISSLPLYTLGGGRQPAGGRGQGRRRTRKRHMVAARRDEARCNMILLDDAMQWRATPTSTGAMRCYTMPMACGGRGGGRRHGERRGPRSRTSDRGQRRPRPRPSRQPGNGGDGGEAGEGKDVRKWRCFTLPSARPADAQVPVRAAAAGAPHELGRRHGTGTSTGGAGGRAPLADTRPRARSAQRAGSMPSRAARSRPAWPLARSPVRAAAQVPVQGSVACAGRGPTATRLLFTRSATRSASVSPFCPSFPLLLSPLSPPSPRLASPPPPAPGSPLQHPAPSPPAALARVRRDMPGAASAR